MMKTSITSKNKVDGNKEKGDEKSARLPQYLATLIVCIGATCSGCHSGWTSPVLPQLRKENSPLSVTLDEATWIASILSIGAACSGIPIGVCSNKFGRKKSLIFIAVPYLISGLLIIFIKDIYALYLARFLAGFSIGSLATLYPTYIMEIADTEIRGSLGISYQAFYNFGIFLANVLGSFLSYIQLSYLLIILPLMYLIGLQFLPESPAYLMMIGHRDKAEKSLRWFRGKEYNINPDLDEIQKQIDSEITNTRNSIKDLFATYNNIKILSVCIGLTFFQQVSGQTAVNYYTVEIFQSTGTQMNSHLEAILVAAVSSLLAGCVFVVVNRLGRKFLLILSGSIMAVCLGSLAFYFQELESGKDIQCIKWLPLPSLMIYMAGYAVGYASLPRVIINEVFVPSLRGYASGCLVTSSWFLTFAVSKSFEYMVAMFGSSNTFYFYMTVCLAGNLYVLFLIPETKGKSLQQIQDQIHLNILEKPNTKKMSLV